MRELELSVEMHCRSCEQRVRRAVRGLHGVRSVSTDLKRQQVVVAFDDDLIDESRLRETVAGAISPPGIAH